MTSLIPGQLHLLLEMVEETHKASWDVWERIFQPPHSPELNPIERFWEFLKSKLQWENCKTLVQLRQKLTEVLRTITPEVIVSLTSYDFILEALFSAAS